MKSIRPAKKPAWNASKQTTILVTVQANSLQFFSHLTLPTAANPDKIVAPIPDTVAGPAPPVLAFDLTATAPEATIFPKFELNSVRKSLLDSDRKLQIVSHAKYLLQMDCKLRCCWNRLKMTIDSNVAMNSKITADMDKFEHHINDMEPKLKLQTESCKLAEEELKVLKSAIERDPGDQNKYRDTYNKMMEKIEVLKGQLIKTAKELERIKRTNSGAYDMWYRLQVENTNDWNRMLQLEQAERVARMLLRELCGIHVEFGKTEVGKTPTPEPGPFETMLGVVYKIMDLKDFTEEEKTIVKENLVGTTFKFEEIFESENPYDLETSRKRIFPVSYNHVCTCSKKTKKEDSIEKSDDESKSDDQKTNLSGDELITQNIHPQTTTIKSDCA
ncbi:Protein CBG25756 [Caenorhabditis briggsae]|uniref:Protein CBG25756 n=1 Tax=Caenorhabditis briggsae TaxID=6238 RepID=B6IHS7_CAEBR|nr:Protein CBG25756 [Caenorhabditis briggsae]CAR99457.1 Protein CBG25756 [Caenorhabditis briggsae]